MQISGSAVAIANSGQGNRDAAFLPLLLVLTFVTGLVDAISYLQLGHVFVANMTGNVVFLGFAIADLTCGWFTRKSRKLYLNIGYLSRSVTASLRL